ncbi:MAG: DUF349 domain-containing protein [Dysgonamonadaceae bacterium]|jgi:hypothetical protein|nr:DUF349 domain-containing protein [Dysgonamonadaceae bacterium]
MSDKVANEEKAPEIVEETLEVVPAVESDVKLEEESEIASETDTATEVEAVIEAESVTETEQVAVEEAVVVDLPDSTEVTEPNTSPNKEAIILRLAEIVVQDISDVVKSEVEALKQAFYRLKNVEVEKALNAFTAGGGAPEDFKPETDETENRLKELLAVFRKKKATLIANNEKVLEENLQAKKAIIKRLKELTDSNESVENFNKIRDEYHKLTQQWREIRQVPQAVANELWHEYQHYNEKFYDLLKINQAMRDYDFKKNLEQKQALCEILERLGTQQDPVSAFYESQKLYHEWRETGPVAKDLRDEIWARFRAASSVINKNYQKHFDVIREEEQRSFAEKTKYCEAVENIDYSRLNSFNEWDRKTKEILEIQKKWKELDLSVKKQNRKIIERFRTACNVFFTRKSAFFQELREELSICLEKKISLCEQAEALKDSTEWKKATTEFIKLQDEWKNIKHKPNRKADSIWKRFSEACDYFFSQKNEHFSSDKIKETENLLKKKEIINNIKEINATAPSKESSDRVHNLMSEWKDTGPVPFSDREKIYKEYRDEVDQYFDKRNSDESKRRSHSPKASADGAFPDRKKRKEKRNGNDKGNGGSKIFFEREKLLRTYERLKSDIQTYENNIGFLSASTKGGGGLIEEMHQKIRDLKENLNSTLKKIETIDEQIENG